MGKFNILWIDDQPQKCKKLKKYIENVILANHLTPNVIIIDKVRKEELLMEGHESNKALRSRNYDLLLIDYKLSDNLLGGEVVSEVREKYNIYTDIVFYSSFKDELIMSIKKSFDERSSLSYFDNIHVLPLDDDAQPKIKKIINKIIESWFNANSIRGVILSESSKFEGLVSEIINNYYAQYIEDLRGLLVKKGKDVVSNTTGKWKVLEKSPNPIEYVLKNPKDFNWNVKKKMLNFFIENNIIKCDPQIKDKLFGLFNLRNDFAHNPVKIEDGVCNLYIDGKTYIYDTCKIQEIRNNISIIEDELLKILSK